jgi:hypothetical protein
VTVGTYVAQRGSGMCGEEGLHFVALAPTMRLEALNAVKSVERQSERLQPDVDKWRSELANWWA